MGFLRAVGRVIADMIANPARYRKFFAALGTVVVEAVALWQDAPGWLVSLAGLVGAYLVYQLPNDQ